MGMGACHEESAAEPLVLADAGTVVQRRPALPDPAPVSEAHEIDGEELVPLDDVVLEPDADAGQGGDGVLGVVVGHRPLAGAVAPGMDGWVAVREHIEW